MTKEILDIELTSRDHENISKHEEYRGGRIENKYLETDYSIEVTGFNPRLFTKKFIHEGTRFAYPYMVKFRSFRRSADSKFGLSGNII